MGIASPAHEPLGPGDLWKTPGLKIPSGIQHIAHDLLEQGRAKDLQSAIRLAVGIMRNFAEGHNGRGQKVHPDTQAAAQRNMAEWEAARAKARATPNKSGGRRMAASHGTVVPTRLSDGTLELAHYGPTGDLLALARYVRTEAGVKRYGLPIGSPIGGGGGGKAKAVAAKATAGKSPKVSAPNRGAAKSPGQSLTVSFGGKSATFRRTADGRSERKDPTTGAWRPSNDAEASLHNAAEQRHGPPSAPAAPAPQAAEQPKPKAAAKPQPAAKPAAPPAARRGSAVADVERAQTAAEGVTPRRFTNVKDANRWLEANKQDVPKSSREAIDTYTKSYQFNRDMRSGKLSKTDKAAVSKIDAAMAPLPEDLLLERGVDVRAFGIDLKASPAEQKAKLAALAGSTFTDKAFMSTSAGPTDFTEGGVVMRIAAPKGTPALNMAGLSIFSDEREMLLARNTRLYITGVKTSGGKTVVNAMVMPVEEKVAA